MMNKVSIIIVSYNEKAYLQRALESCIRQTWSNIEIIIGDDGSSDGSVDIIKTFCHVHSNVQARYFVMDRPDDVRNIIPSIRVSNLLKKGFEIASGDYLVVLSADDYFIDEAKIEKAVRFLSENPKFCAYITGFKYVGAVKGDNYPRRSSKVLYWSGDYLHISCFVFRRPQRLLDRFCDDTGLMYSLLLNGKWKFKFGGYDGLTGETKIVPNYKKKAKPNPYPYILYGSIFNAAFIAVGMYMFFSYKNFNGWKSDIAYLFLTMSIIVFMMLIYNIVPVKMDSMTDGYRLLKAKNVENFNKVLEANNIGEVEVSENGNENAAPKFIPEFALNKVSVCLENEEYDEAFKLLEEIDEHSEELTSKATLSAKAQYIYAFICSKEKQEVLSFYEEKVPFALRRELSNDNSLPVIRTYILMAGILDGSLSECILACKKVVKAYKSVPNNLKHTELVLFNRALEKVKAIHPKWVELDNYQLYE